MDIKTKINEIFNEGLDFGGSSGASFASRKGFKKNGLSLEADKQRKRRERAKQDRLKRLKKENDDRVKNGEQPAHHPREFLDNTPLKFTLLETFVNFLIEYVKEQNAKALNEAIALMEEYPKLGEYVKQTSRKCFNQNEMCVYSIKEHFFEEMEEEIERLEGHRIYHLSIPQAESRHSDRTGYMILETKISPDKILIYIPAFTKDMEKLAFSGKIEEMTVNVLRETKRQNELILLPEVNKGKVIKINN